MKRILTGLILALPIVVTTSLPKPASALEATTNPQLPRAVDQPEYLAQYDGRYQQRDQGRYGAQDGGRRYQQGDQGRYGAQDGGRYQQREQGAAGHYEHRNHRRAFGRGHYIYH